jgi:hypothetical protein
MISEADRYLQSKGTTVQKVFDNSFDTWGDRHNGRFCAEVLRCCPDAARVWVSLDAIEATWCDIVSNSTESGIESLRGWLDRAINFGFNTEDLLRLFADAETIDEARRTASVLMEGPTQ